MISLANPSATIHLPNRPATASAISLAIAPATPSASITPAPGPLAPGVSGSGTAALGTSAPGTPSLGTSAPVTSAPVTSTVLDTLLTHLAGHFLVASNGDVPTARHAASRLLAAYNAETEDELRLAAEIVSFSFHALEALGQAADPTLSLNRKLRLRGGAVSLSRQSHKAQRRLDQLRRARLIPPPRRAPSRPRPTSPGPTGPAATNPASPVSEAPAAIPEADMAASATPPAHAAIVLAPAHAEPDAATQPTGQPSGSSETRTAEAKSDVIPVQVLSRKQRRAAERQAERLRRAKTERARREAAIAARQHPVSGTAGHVASARA